MTYRLATTLSIGLAFAAVRANADPDVPDASPPAATTPPAEPAEPATGAEPPAAAPPPAAPATPAAPAEEENLLAHINDEEAQGKQDTGETFGKSLKFFGIETNWSGYGDFVFEAIPKEKEVTFDASHFNPVFSVRMTDTLSGELELEFEHGGAEINVEYAMVDFAPFGSRELVIRAGKFLVPIGRFNEQLHPSFRWNQIGRPRMMNEVVPVEWSDVGVQVRGQVKQGSLAMDYAVFAVNGLGEHAGETEAVDEEEEEEGGFIRGLRSNALDSNYDKGLGGRLALTSGKSTASTVSVGVSAYTGRVSAVGDPAGPERLTMFDVDAYLRQGSIMINAEVAQTLFGSKMHGYFQSFERGGYLQLAYLMGRTTVAGRYDYTLLGGQEEGLVGELETHHAAALTVKYAPAPSWSVRGEIGQAFQPSDETDKTELSTSLAFVF